MSELTDTLNQIVNWLQKHLFEKYASVNVLKPGLSHQEIERRVGDLPFKLAQKFTSFISGEMGLVKMRKKERNFSIVLFFFL